MRLIFILLILCLQAFTLPKKKFDLNRLPNVSVEMKKVSYWIKRLAQPDKVVLSSSQIKQLNQRLYKKGFLVNPLFENKITSGAMVRNYLENDLKWVHRYYKYDIDNQRMYDPAFTNRMASLTRPWKVRNTLPVKFALFVHPGSIRAFPTDAPLMKRANDYPFDILQHTGTYPGQSFAVFHQTEDGKWSYGQSPYTQGWVKTDSLAFGEKEIIQAFTHALEKGGVVLTPKLKIKHDVYLSMGSRVKVVKETDKRLWISLPQRNQQGQVIFSTHELSKSDVSPTPLPFTAKNLLTQAFKYLGSNYGWGDYQGGIDCSSFLKNVFACVGLKMPRNSTHQAKHLPYRKDLSNYLSASKHDQIKKSHPALSFFHISGPTHIMLYLGEVNDVHYAIHSTWSFKTKEAEHLIQQVVVSDLSLGRGGKEGSLLERISTQVSFQPYIP